MFYLAYIHRELRRRMGRTVLTVLGFAISVGLVVAVTALSAGLDRAQQKILDPLGSVGTDISVTRPLEITQGGGDGGRGPGFGFGGRGDPGGAAGPNFEDQQALLAENQSVLTDLSKLGEPGEKFTHDYFLPATQLTFPADQAEAIAELPGVESVANGMTLLAVHQEGTVPEIVAEVQTGGERIDISERISPPTEAERQQMEECRQQARKSGRSGADAFRDCFPERFLNFRSSIITPQRTIRQALNPPQTDIQSEPYTISGVDVTKPGIGLITPVQVTEGQFFSSEGDEKEAILAEAYAQRKGLDVGSTLKVNGTQFAVVGLAKAPIGGQAADVYTSLANLQELSGRDGRANALLVRATEASSVVELAKAIEKAFPGAQVTSAQDLANRISGSLVDASKLSDRLGFILSVLSLAFIFIFASLLTLSSVAKRVRELGTLKALGWRQFLVVRQVVGESLFMSAIGGLIGIGLGVAVASLIVGFAPALEATAPAVAPSGAFFGLGQIGSEQATAAVRVDAPVDITILLMALGLSLLGGLIAGAVGALRAARLRPADAMRDLG